MLAHGDAQAYTKIMDTYQHHVYDVAHRILKSTVLAEEVVQEVFTKIWLKRESLTAIKNLEAYLYTLGRNFALKQFRTLMQERALKEGYSLGKLHEVCDTDHPIRQEEYGRALTGAIDNLPPQQQTVFRMVKMEGQDYQDIAQQLNISSFTVRNHLAQALRTLRTHFSELPGFLVLLAVLLP